MCPAFSHEKEFSILLREECIFSPVMVCVCPRPRGQFQLPCVNTVLWSEADLTKLLW